MTGMLSFILRGVFSRRHTAYSPPYAAYSPGILIQAEIIREFFGGPYRELDLLGMREDGTLPRHKADWATGRRETVQWTGYRIRGRLLPLIVAKKFKRLPTKGPQKASHERDHGA